MNAFNYNLPVNLYFGRGVFNTAGEITKAYGKKALVVTGLSSTKKTGLLDRLCKLLIEAGVDYVIFDRVPQNPLTTTVYEGVDLLEKTDCDVVFGLGGGSVMDTAKAIAFSALNKGELSDYIYGIEQGKDALPVILAPTTAGTGSEGNCFSVLTNPETKDKKSLKTPAIFPKASLIDADLMVTMPKSVIASTVFDALSHNIEAYIAVRSTPMTDMMALEGIRLIIDNAKKVYEDPSHLEAWDKIVFASTLGGMVICQAGVGAPHALEHPVSGLKDAVHGEGLAALLPAIMEETYPHLPWKFEELTKVLGGDESKEIGNLLRRFLESIHLNKSLTDLGVKEEDIPWLADNSIKTMKANLDNNARVFNKEEIRGIYKRCL
ncbi:MAG: dhaT [Clostridia bacterium]|nr:dhaT [Clostridia bacterium]